MYDLNNQICKNVEPTSSPNSIIPRMANSLNLLPNLPPPMLYSMITLQNCNVANQWMSPVPSRFTIQPSNILQHLTVVIPIGVSAEILLHRA